MLKHNELLDGIERSKAYKSFELLTRAALEQQWEDIAMSGLVATMWDAFAPIFAKHKEKEVTKATSDARRAVNRAILSGQVRSLEKLQRYVEDKVSGKMRRIGGYSGYGMSFKQYLYQLYEKGGQYEIDRYAKGLKFKLSKQYYRNLVNTRVKKFVTGVDNTTKKRFAATLIRGLDAGDSKKDLVKRLMKEAPTMARYRADRIARTESHAAVEYMRHETAKLNGIQYKLWNTVLDERTGHIDRLLDQDVAIVGHAFKYEGIEYPPVHPNCRCTVDYLYDRSDALIFISDTDLSAMEDLYKAQKGAIYDESIEVDFELPTFNRKALWVGGEKLVGEDARVQDYAKELKQEGRDAFMLAWKGTNFDELDEWAAKLDKLSRELKTSKVYSDVDYLQVAISGNYQIMGNLPTGAQLGGTKRAFLILVQARAWLSDEGFVQLTRWMGSAKKNRRRKFVNL